jgi:protein transport protein SEC61 subunit gamma-like protein
MAALLKLRTSVLPIAGVVFLPDPTTTLPHLVIRQSTPHRGLQALDHACQRSVQMDTVVNPLKDFAKNSVRLVKRCTKPDRRGADASPVAYGVIWKSHVLHLTLAPVYAEFNKITIRTAIGFVVMGFIGFFVKLIFIVSYVLDNVVC